jgi:hypothetical protein
MKDIAQSRGIGGFSATVLRSNSRMLHLFHKVYSPLRSEINGNVYSISCRFADTDELRRQRRAAPSQPSTRQRP